MSASRDTSSRTESFEFSLAHLTALDLTPPELIMAASFAQYQFVGLRLIPVTAGGAAWSLWADKSMMAGTYCGYGRRRTRRRTRKVAARY
jgi:hypothetical protein